MRAETEHGARDDRERDDGERHRATRQHAVADQEEHQRRHRDGQDHRVCAGKLVDQGRDSLEEVIPTARNAERARELRHRDADSGARLEADQDGIAHEAGERAQAERPRRGGERGDEKRGERRYFRKSPRVAAGHRRDARPDE